MTTDAATYFALLVRHETALWNAADRGLRDAGAALRLGRLEVLRVIRDLNGAGRVQDVAEHLGTTVGAASRLVDRIEADAFIERQPNPTDRRSSLLELTGEGVSALAAGEAAFDASVSRLLSSVPATELEALMAALRRVDDILSDSIEASE
jgi:DNA-binding MarR family transcriptional regulator